MLVVKQCQTKNTQYKDKDNGNCDKHNFDLFKSSLPTKITTAKIRFVCLPPNGIICHNFLVVYIQL